MHRCEGCDVVQTTRAAKLLLLHGYWELANRLPLVGVESDKVTASLLVFSQAWGIGMDEVVTGKATDA